MKRADCIKNHREVTSDPMDYADVYKADRRSLSGATGAKQLGCSHYVLPPGKTAWPAHKHFGNEEALYILSGKGRVVLDDVEYAVGPGDYVTLLAGGPNHQLFAADDSPLEYLCLSTMHTPDVFTYPGTDKLGVIAGVAPLGDPMHRTMFEFYKRGSQVDYWEGE